MKKIFTPKRDYSKQERGASNLRERRNIFSAFWISCFKPGIQPSQARWRKVATIAFDKLRRLWVQKLKTRWYLHVSILYRTTDSSPQGRQQHLQRPCRLATLCIWTRLRTGPCTWVELFLVNTPSSDSNGETGQVAHFLTLSGTTAGVSPRLSFSASMMLHLTRYEIIVSLNLSTLPLLQGHGDQNLHPQPPNKFCGRSLLVRNTECLWRMMIGYLKSFFNEILVRMSRRCSFYTTHQL